MDPNPNVPVINKKADQKFLEKLLHNFGGIYQAY